MQGADAAYLRYFSPQHEPRLAVYMEKPVKIAQVGWQVGWGMVSGNHQGRVNRGSQDDGD